MGNFRLFQKNKNIEPRQNVTGSYQKKSVVLYLLDFGKSKRCDKLLVVTCLNLSRIHCATGSPESYNVNRIYCCNRLFTANES